MHRLPLVTPVPGGELDVRRSPTSPGTARCPLLVLRMAPSGDHHIARCMGARDGPVVENEYLHTVCENDRHRACPYFVYTPVHVDPEEIEASGSPAENGRALHLI